MSVGLSALSIATACGLGIACWASLGVELLNGFHGRALEIFARARRNRDRYGEVLDHGERAAKAAEYLRVVGNSLFLVAGTAACITLADQQASGQVLLGCVLAASLIALVLQLWIPRALARFASAPVLYYTWPAWRLQASLLRPLAWPGELFEKLAQRIAGLQQTEEELEEEELEDEIRTIVTVGARDGVLTPDLTLMIENVMDLHQATVQSIMTPRSQVDAIEVDQPWNELLPEIAASGRSRVPVYRGTMDEMVGVLFVKDLLPEMMSGQLPSKPLSELMRRAWFVPASRQVNELLREFLHSRSHMAIVLDEFHQFAGVVTIEDALEEIVGEIVDESDEDEQAEIRMVDESTAEVAGRALVTEVNELTGWGLEESDDYETVAGFVLHHTGTVPDSGTTVTIGPVEIEILNASRRQIDRLRLRPRKMAVEL